jgi:hypothetical protein
VGLLVAGPSSISTLLPGYIHVARGHLESRPSGLAGLLVLLVA